MCNCFKTWRNVSAIMLLLGITSLMPETASAQMFLGGGLVYGADIESLGLQANGHLVVNEENKLRIGADITYYFPKKTDTAFGDITTNIFAIDVNGHYMFVTSEELIMYAIGGLNLAIVSLDLPGGTSTFVDNSGSDLGINLGGGLEFALPFGRFYAELKYTVGGFDQLEIGAGVRVPLLGGDN